MNTVALLGTLEQFGLINVLQRVETYGKTGVLVMKRGEQWVELYFRQGQLICIGPVRGNTTLGDRLLYARVVTPRALQDTYLAMGGSNPPETRLALTLMNLGYVTRDSLRTWSMKEAGDVIRSLMTWPNGEVYFEDSVHPPTDRLLVGLSVTALLHYLANPAPEPIQAPETPPPVAPTEASPSLTSSPTYPQLPLASQPTPSDHDQSVQPRLTRNLSNSIPSLPTMEVPVVASSPSPEAVDTTTTLVGSESSIGGLNIANLFDGSNLFADTPNESGSSRASENFPNFTRKLSDDDSSDSPMGIFEGATPDTPSGIPSSASNIESSPATSLSLGGMGDSLPEIGPPIRITTPLPARRIDTSFMYQDMILLPTDLSNMRQQQIQLQFTPDQWRVFTQIDGRTTLQMMCQKLALPGDYVCQVAGELIAMGVISISSPMPTMNEYSPAPQHLVGTGMENGYGYVAGAAQPWAAMMSTMMEGPGGVPIETQSQWGNGGNGATFVPGRGWVLNASQAPEAQFQPVEQPYPGNNLYAPANGYPN